MTRIASTRALDAPAVAPPNRVLAAQRVFTGAAATWQPDTAIVLEDGRIAWIGPRVELPATYATWPLTDFGDATILPGLIETHAHLGSFAYDFDPDVPDPGRHKSAWFAFSSVALARQLASVGVTTVQSLGARHFSDVALREAINAGLVEGPRIVAAGPQITTTAGHSWTNGGEVSSITDIVHTIRDFHKAGVDVIKVMATGGFMTPGTAPWNAQFTTAELAALVVEAHRLGKHTAAHAHGTQGIRRAVEAGLDYIAHATFVGEDGRTDFDPALADLMAERGIFVDVCAPPSYPPVAGETGTPQAYKLYRRGVKIVTGHDIGAVVPPSAYTYGLRQLEASGLPRGEVLIAATSRAAAAVGLAGVTGALLPGYTADLIVTPGDPLADLGALDHLTEIIISGRHFAPVDVPPFDPAARRSAGLAPGRPAFGHPNDVRAAWLTRCQRALDHPTLRVA
jgi:imidazolonepropionase-like amidohydrolase